MDHDDDEEEEGREVLGLLASAGKADEVQELLTKAASLKGTPSPTMEDEGGEFSLDLLELSGFQSILFWRTGIFFFFEVPPPRTSGQIFSPALVDFSSLFSLPLFAPLFLVQTILVPPLLDYRGRMGGQRALGQKLGNSS